MGNQGSPVLVLVKQILVLSCIGSIRGQNDLDFWNVERPKDMSNLASLEVMCGKTYMEVQVSFDRPFNGIIFSKGAVDQYNCIYVKPQTGSASYSFNIMYDQCGTKPDMNGKFYENNIVIQYDKDLIEVWDEAKRLRCEWYNDYEKGITKAPIRVSDLEVVELNFRGDNVDCWMEIQHGKGPWASAVSGIVPLGTTLTMVVGINDKQGEFDMRVKSCSAESENSRAIQLSDEHGCVLRPKMISKFMKIAGADTRASVITYAFFHAFKFPDSMSVHVKCKVEICRFGCPDHCQKPSSYRSQEQDVSASVSSPSYKPGPRFEAHKADKRSDKPENQLKEILDKTTVNRQNDALRRSDEAFRRLESTLSRPEDAPRQLDDSPKRPEDSPRRLDDIVPPVRTSPDPNPRYMPRADQPNLPETNKQSSRTSFLGIKLPSLPRLSNIFGDKQSDEEPVFQRRPESVPVQRTDVNEFPQVYPSSFNSANSPEVEAAPADSRFPHGPRGLNLEKRAARQIRSSEELGVTSGYQVISEVDLAFKPSFENGMGVAVFQGKMLPEEVIYGVCLPATGFSAMFVLISLLTVISVLISGFVCYHRQIQKHVEEGAPTAQSSKPRSSSSSSTEVTDWGSISSLFRMNKV